MDGEAEKRRQSRVLGKILKSQSHSHSHSHSQQYYFAFAFHSHLQLFFLPLTTFQFITLEKYHTLKYSKTSILPIEKSRLLF